MSLTRRAVLVGIPTLTTAGILKSGYAQGAYPAGIGTIKVVVPFPPGGASDIIGRLLAESLTRRWKATAVLENIAGGASTTGIGRVANGPKDGSQILILGFPFVTTQFVMPKLGYDRKSTSFRWFNSRASRACCASRRTCPLRRSRN